MRGAVCACKHGLSTPSHHAKAYMWLQEVQLLLQSRTRCLKAVLEEWHAAAAFQAYSQRILAACVARMKGQAVAAAFDTWRYEVCHAYWAAHLP